MPEYQPGGGAAVCPQLHVANNAVLEVHGNLELVQGHAELGVAGHDDLVEGECEEEGALVLHRHKKARSRPTARRLLLQAEHAVLDDLKQAMKHLEDLATRRLKTLRDLEIENAELRQLINAG